MLGIYFYLQIFFAILLFMATSSAIYMGIFHAHREQVTLGKKYFSAFCSGAIALVINFFMYSWSYLSW